MLKKALLFLSAVTFLGAVATTAQTQPCGTDEMHQLLKEKYPQIAELEAQIAEGLSHMDVSKYAKSTDADQLGNTNFIYDIPIVVHIIHTYGSEYFSDNYVYESVDDWNIVFAKQNADTSVVIPAFKKYIGNARIKLHLAKFDPQGNPTNGITRHHSYLTNYGSNQAKIGGWPNTSYMNIWVVRKMDGPNSGAAAFALKPPGGQALPWYDGVISIASAVNNDKTMNHELAHTFNIDHVWGGNNNPGGPCGDDAVDDTPPTRGHLGNGGTGCNHPAPANSVIYDSICSFGYLKVYPSSTFGIDSLVDYPDTNNSQNIMDYTGCSRMFTRGQVHRMHEALNSNTAGRSNLWSVGNLNATGVSAPRVDLKPAPDFFTDVAISSNSVPIGTRPMYFMCAGTNDKFVFKNASWRDTVTNVNWTLSNGSNVPSSTSTVVQTNFNTPGWVDISLTASSNAGDSTISKKLVYAADGANKIDPVTNGFYFQEFSPSSPDLDKYPIFNYYNNNFKWQINNSTGYYDNSCMMYTGYDTRTQPDFYVGSPEGDVDDFFTPAFNLSSMATGPCNLNYMFAGTALSAFYTDMKDLLIISYSTTCGKSWDTIRTLKEDEIFNNGNVLIPYQPAQGVSGEWGLMSINIPTAARVDGVFFRFTYAPHTNANGDVTSNNFYMDRLNISNFPTGANTLINDQRNVVVAPNPTTGSSTVIIKGDIGGDANVVVTDITGKLVYKTSQKINSEYVTIEIPSESLTAKGIYMVQVVTNNQSHTEKLIVY